MPEEPKHREPLRYANFLAVQFNLNEVVLDFGQKFDQGEPQLHTGIVTTPLCARAFLETLEESIRRHRQRYSGQSEPEAIDGSSGSE